MKKAKQISRKFLWAVFAVLALVFSFTVYASFGNLNAEKYSAKLERPRAAEKINEKMDDKESVLPNYNDDRVLDYEPGVVNVKWKNAGQKGNLLAKAKTKFKDLQNKDIFPLNKKIEGKKSLLQNRLKFGLDRIQTVRSESIRDKVAKLEPDLTQIKKDYLKSISIKNGVNVNKKSKAIVKEFTLEDVPFFMTEDGKIQDELTLNLQKEFKDAEYAELNKYYHLTAPINEPYYPEMWSLQKESTKYPILDNNLDGDFDEEGENGQSAENAGISAEEGWANDTSNGGEGVIVAVIDTGLDINHEDIKDNVWINKDEIPDNEIDDDKNGYIDDVNGFNFSEYNTDISDPIGHGSHCAGTIAAVQNNIGVIGIAYNAKIMPVRVFPNSVDSVIANGIYYAVNNGAGVMSMSFGGATDNTEGIITDAIKFSATENVVSVVAAGNDAKPAEFFNPANVKEAITVAATDADKKIAYFSNFGIFIDIAAPGTNILSLRGANTDIYCPVVPSSCGKKIYKEKYYLMNGTSMATPHISGVVAIAKALYPDWTVDQITQLIRYAGGEGNTTYIPSLNFSTELGYGKINLAKLTNFKNQKSDMPQAIIKYPKNNEEISGIINIEGTANKGFTYYPSDFGRWELVYKRVDNDDSAIQIPVNSDLAKQEVNGILGKFDTTLLPKGDYYFQLRVYNNTNSFYAVDTVRATVDNLIFTSPNPDIFNIFGKKDINFTAKIGVSENAKFALDYRDNKNPNCTPANDDPACWIIINKGEILKGYYEGTVGTFKYDKNNLRKGIYQIRLKVYYDYPYAFSDFTTQELIIDDNIKEGWPVSLERSTSADKQNYIPNIPATTVSDINGDGFKEIIVLKQKHYDIKGSEFSKTGTILAYDYTGKLLWSYELNLDFLPAYDVEKQSPALYDIDNDGKKEIFFIVMYVNKTDEKGRYSHSYLVQGLDSNGKVLPNFPLLSPFGELKPTGNDSRYIYSLIVEDVNNDKKPEFIFASFGGELGVASLEGKPLYDNWPKYTNNYEANVYPAVGDINGDGYKDIVFAGYPMLYVYSGKDGTVLWERELSPDPDSYNSNLAPILADLDDDGNFEIVTEISKDNDGRICKLYVLDSQGNIKSNWPQQIEEDQTHNLCSFAVGDIDNDKKLEIIVHSLSHIFSDNIFHVYAFGVDGNIKWEYKTDTRVNFMFSIKDNPIITNLNGDNLPDILLSDYQNLYLLNNSGSLISPPYKIATDNFYRQNDLSFSYAGDIDKDNKIEIVTSIGYKEDSSEGKDHVVVYDLDAPVVNGLDYWPKIFHDEKNTSCYAPNLPPVADANDAATEPVVPLNKVVQLDGSKSYDPENKPLTYRWILLLKPFESKAVLSNPNIVNPTFIPDKSGSYYVKLYVSDGVNESLPAGVDFFGEITAPTVTIVSPKSNEIVKGTVTITANLASKQTGHKMVLFYIDGDDGFIGAKQSEPYQIKWDSTTVSDGKHTIKAVGKDTGGEHTAVIVIYVQNKVPQIKKSLKPISK